MKSDGSEILLCFDWKIIFLGFFTIYFCHKTKKDIQTFCFISKTSYIQLWSILLSFFPTSTSTQLHSTTFALFNE